MLEEALARHPSVESRLDQQLLIRRCCEAPRGGDVTEGDCVQVALIAKELVVVRCASDGAPEKWSSGQIGPPDRPYQSPAAPWVRRWARVGNSSRTSVPGLIAMNGEGC